MICSVLTPSRKHPDGLLHTVRSIASTVDTSKVEHLIRLDDDDGPSAAIIPELQKFAHVKVVIGPRGSGYTDMGKFITELSHLATGKWITMLDDDCTLDKRVPPVTNWETQLEEMPDWGAYVSPEFYYLGPSRYPSGSCSPVGWFAPRNFWERFGFSEMGVPCDSWTCALLRDQQQWPVRMLRGIIYNHQRDEARNRD